LKDESKGHFQSVVVALKPRSTRERLTIPLRATLLGNSASLANAKLTAVAPPPPLWLVHRRRLGVLPRMLVKTQNEVFRISSRVASSRPFYRRLGLSLMVLNPRLGEPIEFV
jgi:hypothetical protein